MKNHLRLWKGHCFLHPVPCKAAASSAISRKCNLWASATFAGMASETNFGWFQNIWGGKIVIATFNPFETVSLYLVDYPLPTLIKSIDSKCGWLDIGRCATSNFSTFLHLKYILFFLSAVQIGGKMLQKSTQVKIAEGFKFPKCTSCVLKKLGADLPNVQVDICNV